jgi:phosphoglycolate phosphatase
MTSEKQAEKTRPTNASSVEKAQYHEEANVQPKYELVIFDWDGTLMNSEARIVSAIQHAAEDVGLPVLSDEQSKQIIGLSLEHAILGLYPDATPQQVEAMAKAYTQHFLEDSEVPMHPFEGAEDLLKALKNQGAKLAIATGKSRRGLDQVLREVGFGPYFDITRTPVEAASKPDPLMLHQILEALDVPLERAVMVGDTEFDLLMAQKAGMDSVAMTHGVHALEHLKQFQPVVYADDLTELKNWLLPRVASSKAKVEVQTPSSQK